MNESINRLQTSVYVDVDVIINKIKEPLSACAIEAKPRTCVNESLVFHEF